MARVLVLTTSVLTITLVGQAAAAVAPHGPPFMFGGIGTQGPYTVTITAGGSVSATGDGGLTRLGASQLSPSQLSALNRSVTLAHFGSLRALTRCPGATPYTTTWIRVGSKKVSVAGSCSAAYQRLHKAFIAATRFYAST